MVAKEKLSQLDVTYCLTFILLESFNNFQEIQHIHSDLKNNGPEVQPGSKNKIVKNVEGTI